MEKIMMENAPAQKNKWKIDEKGAKLWWNGNILKGGWRKSTCAKTTPAKTPETASKVIPTTADNDDVYYDPI